MLKIYVAGKWEEREQINTHWEKRRKDIFLWK